MKSAEDLTLHYYYSVMVASLYRGNVVVVARVDSNTSMFNININVIARCKLFVPLVL